MSAHEGDVAQLLRVRALVRGELRVQISEQIQRTSSTGRRGDFARPCGSPGKDPRFRAADRGRPVDNLGWAGETFPCIDKGLRALLRRRHRGRAGACKVLCQTPAVGRSPPCGWWWVSMPRSDERRSGHAWLDYDERRALAPLDRKSVV